MQTINKVKAGRYKDLHLFKLYLSKGVTTNPAELKSIDSYQ